ncbi:MAG TPA: MerR family transcriptional regulator [Thermotogota bacterium]|nr:MerR family transcriptional regulator [Thermotogota bacterium]NLH18679.1 MerR family transcriptional regulator [Thermotogaceae bacterium]OQC30156.1 MAG: putative heat shock protein HspR [Thermotogota bacterium ADurb.Bin062]HNW47493.1 MerR family transcriptional regulator [Thermotogota bacterium]HOD91981.1 MerR family transcriptional regulator [Thermotogota bacterium]
MEDRRKPSKEKASRPIPPDEANMPKFIISVAAKMLQLHPQTLRQYEKRGYVTPFRLGNLRLYSERDIHTINRIKELADEGIPTNGIDRILALERRIEELERLLEAYEIEIVSLKNRIRKEVPPLPVKIEVKSYEFQFYGESSKEEDEDTR